MQKPGVRMRTPALLLAEDAYAPAILYSDS